METKKIVLNTVEKCKDFTASFDQNVNFIKYDLSREVEAVCEKKGVIYEISTESEIISEMSELSTFELYCFKLNFIKTIISNICPKSNTEWNEDETKVCIRRTDLICIVVVNGKQRQEHDFTVQYLLEGSSKVVPLLNNGNYSFYF